jgi:integrase
MAKVRKRRLPSNKIVWQADYRDRDGVRRSKQFSTRGAADSFLVKARRDLQLGVHVAAGASITVADAGQLWLERAQRDNLTRSTIEQYQRHVRLHINPRIGTVKLPDLTAPRIAQFVDDMLVELSRPLARKVLTSLGSLVDEAIRAGRHTNNPVRLAKLPRVQAEETEGDTIAPTKDELRAILTAADDRWRPIIVTAMFTGMRASELRGVLWSDVDLTGGIVRVRRRADAWGVSGPPKSKAGKRDIPLAPMVVTALKQWKLACPKGEQNPLGLVFPSPLGAVQSHACILKDGFWPTQMAAGVVRPALDADGRPKTDAEGAPIVRAKYGLHALRHAAAALFIEQGFGPKKVQTIMGHSSIKVTFDLYGYLFEAHASDREAMAAIETRLLGG